MTILARCNIVAILFRIVATLLQYCNAVLRCIVPCKHHLYEQNNSSARRTPCLGKSPTYDILRGSKQR